MRHPVPGLIVRRSLKCKRRLPEGLLLRDAAAALVGSEFLDLPSNCRASPTDVPPMTAQQPPRPAA
jgi:hypothetical protein